MDMVNIGSDGDQVIRAARLLMSKDMAPGVKELTDRAKQRAHELRMVPLLATARETIAEEWPGLYQEEVEQFLRSFAEWMVDEDDNNAGPIFYDLAVEFGWMTKEKLLADRAAYGAERTARIQDGKPTAPPPPPESSLISMGNVLSDSLDQALLELHR
jgi:hypothetical protein